MKLSKLNKILFSATIPALALSSCVVVASCGDNNTFTITYGNDSRINWTSKPTSIKKGEDFKATYTISDSNYYVKDSSTSLTVGGKSVKGQTGVLCNNGVVTIPGSLVTGNISVSLVTAKQTVIEYHSVTLHANGGTFKNGTDTLTISNLSSVSSSKLEVPTKAGTASETYTFYGWYYDEELTNPVSLPITSLTSDLNFYAKYATEVVTAGICTSTDEQISIVTDDVNHIVTCTVKASTTNADRPITIKGQYTGYQILIVPDTGLGTKTTLNITLEDCNIKSNKNHCPIHVATVGDDEFKQVTFTVKSSTGAINTIYDAREYGTTVEDDSDGAITVDDADVIFTGTGALKINDANNKGYCRGIECGKLTIDSLTLQAYGYENAIRGKKSITISSGNVYCYSPAGDGLKTKNVKLKSGKSESERNGNITINGTAKVEISVAGDGIDATNSVVISDTAVVNIVTGTKSSYCVSSAAKALIDKQDLYFQTSASLDETNYYYAVVFSNESTWAQALADENKEVVYPNIKKNLSRGRFFNFDCPDGYTYGYIAKYSSSNDETPILTGGRFTCPTTHLSESGNNCISITEDSSIISTGSWANYKRSVGAEVLTKSGLTEWGSKGIKADNNITISGGTINVDCCDDGIKTKHGVVWTAADATTYGVSTGDITISGGTIIVNAADDGIHADNILSISGSADIDVETSFEGIEAGDIEISGGDTYVYCTNDAMNAAETGKISTSNIKLNITGGYLDLTAYGRDVDGIDSNKDYTQSGGVVITRGSSGTCFDLGEGQSGKVTGGTLVCIGNLDTMGGGTTITAPHTYSYTTGYTQGNYTITIDGTSYDYTNLYSYNKIGVYTAASSQPTIVKK